MPKRGKGAKVTKRRELWAILGCIVLLFAFSLARFAYDVSRLNSSADDLVSPWTSSKVFVEGKNPYNDAQEFARISSAVRDSSPDSCPGEACDLSQFRMVYPPSVFPIISPLTLLPWRVAVYVYLVGSTVLFVAMLLMLAQKLQLPWSNPRKLYMIAFSLALAPLHASIHVSNLNTLVVAFLGIGVIFMRKRPYLSGIALAISMCLKPQVAFLFFAYPWLRKNWKTAFTGLATCTAILTSSLFWMRIHHVEWFRGYLGLVIKPYLVSAPNVSSIQRTAVPYFYNTDPIRYLSTNLQVLIFQFTHSPHYSNVISWTLFLLLAAVAAFLIHSRVSEKYEAIDIAIISVLTLLPVYQNFYTAAILIFVVYWAIQNWPLKRAKASLLLMLTLLLPFVAMTRGAPSLAGFVERHHLSSYFFWNAFIMPHVVWIELFLVFILLSAARGKDSPHLPCTEPV